MQPYVPQIYSIGSRSRFWPYGTPYVRTPIPGAGFKGRRMYYEAQPMDLGGLGQAPAHSRPYPLRTGVPGGGAYRAAVRAAVQIIRDPRQKFVVAEAQPGRQPVTVRGYRAAVRKARQLSRRWRRPIYVHARELLRRNIMMPLTTVNPTGEVMVNNVSLGGLGQDIDPGRAVTVIANLLVDPERELSRRGAALAQALDRHVATPLVDSMGRQMQPYFWKWVFPPLLVLYAITSIAAIKAWQAEARLAGRG